MKWRFQHGVLGAWTCVAALLVACAVAAPVYSLPLTNWAAPALTGSGDSSLASSASTAPLPGSQAPWPESTPPARGAWPADTKRAGRPLLLVVGASFSAGLGAQSRATAWPYLLADRLGWQAAVRAVPGAGYVQAGRGGGGPLAKEIASLDVSRLDPAVVIVQAGHNDVGAPLGLVHQRVQQVVETIRREAPRAQLALITVFPGRRPGPATAATDRTIVDSAKQVDPGVAIMDPLTQGWAFPASSDHFHPSQAGHRWIADRVIGSLGTPSAPPG